MLSNFFFEFYGVAYEKIRTTLISIPGSVTGYNGLVWIHVLELDLAIWDSNSPKVSKHEG